MVGSRIVRKLIEKGEDVVVYDLKIDEEVLDFVLTDEQRNHVSAVEGNILDYEHLTEVCGTYQVDKMIHTASMMGNSTQPMLATNVNSVGMMSVLETVKNLSLKLVYTSTNSVFSYNDKDLIPWDRKYSPDSNYGCTKVFNELSAEMYHRTYGLDIIGVRVGAMIFGEYQRRGLTASIADEAVYKPATGIPGNVQYNDEALGWIYVEDAAEAHVKAWEKKRTENMAGIYNVAGTIFSMKDLTDFVKKLVPEAQITLGDRKTGQHFWRLDTSLTEKELGYKNEWDVWEAWKKVIIEIRKHNGLPVKMDQ